LIAGLVVLTVRSLSALRPQNRHSNPETTTLLAFGVASWVGIAWTLRDFNGWPDVFALLPFAALGVGGLADAVTERISKQQHGVALVVGCSVIAAGIAMSHSVADRDRTLDLQKSSVDAVLDQLPPDASILSIQAPQALVLSGKTNATRHQMFSGPLLFYLEDSWPGGLEGYGEWVGQEQPAVIALGTRDVPDWLRETIEEGYVRVGHAPGWVWFAHRAIGPRNIREMRSAVTGPSDAESPESAS
jgi:hypothetical protein